MVVTITYHCMCSKSTTYLVHSQINFSFTSGGPTYYVYKKAIWLSKTARCSISMVITEVKITIKHIDLKFYGQIDLLCVHEKLPESFADG